MKRISILLFILLMPLSFVRCDRVPELPAPWILLSHETVSAPAFEVDYDIDVSANIAWKIASNDIVDWAVPSVTFSRGTGSFILHIEPNEGEAREGKIVLSSEDGSVTREIHVRQRAANGPGQMTVAELRALERTEGYILPEGCLSGFVVTSAEAANFPERCFALSDSFSEEESGIVVEVPQGEFKALPFGSFVTLGLSGARLFRDGDGLLKLRVSSAPEAEVSAPMTIKAASLSFDELSSGKYESMYVCLPACQVIKEEIGGVLGGCPKICNEDENRFARLMVSSESPLAEVSYNSGGGSVKGVAGAVHEAVSDIRPMSESDVVFTSRRLDDKPGARLPYVFSFYCNSTRAGDFKYIEYYKLAYNSATSLISGVIAKDLDEDVGAVLEMTAFGKASSNTYGPAPQTQAAACDYIEAASFVSLDNPKTKPTAECGYWLTVPLSRALPNQFTVSFGMAGSTYVLRTWDVWYSSDKNNWMSGGEVTLDHVVENGSWYCLFSVPVTSQIAFPAGSTLYLKLVPQGQYCIGKTTAGYDGHGTSCRLRLHSGIVIASGVPGSTEKPQDAVYFQPFDALTGGVDYFIGDGLGGLANKGGKEISSWSTAQRGGMSGSSVYERPGYAQIGFADTERSGSGTEFPSAAGELETPALGASGTLHLSFKAAAYRTPAIRSGAPGTTPDVGSPDITDAVLEILGGGTVGGSTTVSISGLPVTYSMKEYSFTIDGATSSTRLRFTSAPDDGQFCRWFIDDILVTK